MEVVQDAKPYHPDYNCVSDSLMYSHYDCHSSTHSGYDSPIDLNSNESSNSDNDSLTNGSNAKSDCADFHNYFCCFDYNFDWKYYVYKNS